jgi:hypothetical protein
LLLHKTCFTFLTSSGSPLYSFFFGKTALKAKK